VIRFIRRYRWWILIVILGCYFLVYAHLVPFPLPAWGDKVTEQNFYRIQIGMTEQEVTKILGRPGLEDVDPWKKNWDGQRVYIDVEFDEKSGKLKRKKLIQPGRVTIEVGSDEKTDKVKGKRLIEH
jgi:hypothetical protein